MAIEVKEIEAENGSIQPPMGLERAFKSKREEDIKVKVLTQEFQNDPIFVNINLNDTLDLVKVHRVSAFVL